MRVLFLLTQDLESPSGLGRYWPLARHLVRLGHTVTVAALHSNFEALSQTRFIREGVDIWYVAPMHVRKQGNLKSYYPPLRLLWIAARATWQLGRAALTIPADIIHLGKPHPMNGIAGLLGKFLRGRRLFLDCDDIEVGINRFSAGWQKQGVAFFENWLPRRVDGVTTHTYVNQERLLALGVPAGQLFYISNGVDRERFAPPPAELVAALRDKIGLSGKQVVAYIGSLSLAGHPVDLLLDSFSLVAAEHPDVVLLLVGGGEDYEKLRAQAQALGLADRVRFCGRVPPEEAVLYYDLADVSVDPVHNDEAARGRSPLKLFESWACGIPFVTADVGDRRRLVGEPPAGKLAKPSDPHSLADAIIEVLTHPELAAALRLSGLQRVEEYYWENLSVKLENIYQNESGISKHV